MFGVVFAQKRNRFVVAVVLVVGFVFVVVIGLNNFFYNFYHSFSNYQYIYNIIIIIDNIIIIIIIIIINLVVVVVIVVVVVLAF